MKKILLIEDDYDIRSAMVDTLSVDYDVTIAPNGQEGLAYLRDVVRFREVLPDLILLDLIMPIKDGFQFLREQKNDYSISHIPVVVMSANRLQDKYTLMCNGFLKKPVDIDVLSNAINRALCRQIA